MDQHVGIIHTAQLYHCVVHQWEAVNICMQQHLLEISLCLLVTSVPGGSEDLLEHLERVHSVHWLFVLLWLFQYWEAVKLCVDQY